MGGRDQEPGALRLRLPVEAVTAELRGTALLQMTQMGAQMTQMNYAKAVL
jgi:hypothetical protein